MSATSLSPYRTASLACHCYNRTIHNAVPLVARNTRSRFRVYFFIYISEKKRKIIWKKKVTRILQIRGFHNWQVAEDGCSSASFTFFHSLRSCAFLWPLFIFRFVSGRRSTKLDIDGITITANKAYCYPPSRRRCVCRNSRVKS